MAGAIAVNNKSGVRNDMRLQDLRYRRWVFESCRRRDDRTLTSTGPASHHPPAAMAAIMRGPKITRPVHVRRTRNATELRGHPDPGRSSSPGPNARRSPHH